MKEENKNNVKGEERDLEESILRIEGYFSK
jgi:hypothetical protein